MKAALPATIYLVALAAGLPVPEKLPAADLAASGHGRFRETIMVMRPGESCEKQRSC